MRNRKMIGAWGKGKPRRWLKQNILDDTMKKKKNLEFSNGG